jgi:hypothetical protein
MEKDLRIFKKLALPRQLGLLFPSYFVPAPESSKPHENLTQLQKVAMLV